MLRQVGLTSPPSFRASTLPPIKLHAATIGNRPLSAETSKLSQLTYSKVFLKCSSSMVEYKCPSFTRLSTASRTCASVNRPVSAVTTVCTLMPLMPSPWGPSKTAFTTSKHEPSAAAAAQVTSVSLFLGAGQPFARAHCSTSRCPPHDASTQVSSSHGQPFARNHCSTSRCPPLAAPIHVFSSHGHPFARAHCSTSRCPPSAANSHVIQSHGQPFARAHCSTSRCPP